MTNVLLIGAGGVGTIVAYGIDYSGKSSLSLVVRRDYDKVKNDGYDIKSIDYGNVTSWKPANIFPSVEHAAKETEYDFAVICTKNLPDFAKPEEVARAAITPGKTSVVLMQNGFDLGRPFFEKFPENVVISGVSYIGAHNRNGVVVQTQPDKTFISYFENPNLSKQEQEAKTKEFIALYGNDKNDCSYHDSAKWMRYKKLIYNATLNTTCALTGVDTGRLDLSGGLDSIALPAMREVVAVAKADGVELPADVINSNIHSDDGDWFEPSMLVDVRKGNPMELEVILGNLLRVARELKVSTPTLDVLYNLLKVVQLKTKEVQGLITLPAERPIIDRFYQ